MTDSLSVPLVALTIAIVVVAIVSVALIIWIAILSKRLKKVSATLIDERKKVSQIARYLTGRSGKLELQEMSRRAGTIEDALYDEYDPEDDKLDDSGFGKRGKHTLGRKKPVIPFGVDKTVQDRAAHVAAAQIDEGQNRSIELNEPDRAHPSRTLPGAMRAAGAPNVAQMPNMQTNPAMMAQMHPLPSRPDQGVAAVQPVRPVQPMQPVQAVQNTSTAGPVQPSIMSTGQQAVLRQGIAGQMHQPVQSAQSPQAMQQPQINGNTANQTAVSQQAVLTRQLGRQSEASQTTRISSRTVVEQMDPASAEKAAISAAWLAEEEHRLSVKAAREAARAQAEANDAEGDDSAAKTVRLN